MRRVADLEPAGWRVAAACTGRDVNLWFDENHVSEAKTVCATCEVKDDCLAWAVRHVPHDNECGVWGGLTGSERRSLARRSSMSGSRRKQCAWPTCDTWFEPYTANTKFCSDECASLSRAKHRREQRRAV